jgi:hypothetical protein
VHKTAPSSVLLSIMGVDWGNDREILEEFAKKYVSRLLFYDSGASC